MLADYTIGKNKVGEVFTVNPDIFVFTVDLVGDVVLQIRHKEFGTYVIRAIPLSASFFKHKFCTVLMEL